MAAATTDAAAATQEADGSCGQHANFRVGGTRCARRGRMPKRVASALDALRQSLWVIPALAVAGSVVIAELMVWLSRGLGLERIRFVFGGGADAAQAVLQAIAGSVITVAGVTFSITIIALQLTSTQFSPRVLRNFMRDRASQSVFATFLATFVYALAVLGSVRTGSDGEAPFVPTIAIGGALALTLLSIAMLTFFIHHIAHTIQVSAITESVSRETLASLRREWPEERPEAANGVPATDPDATVLTARQGGYLSYAAHPRLVQLAAKADARLHMHLAPGQWVSEGRPLLSVAPANAAERLSGDPRDEIKLSAQPTLQQDPSFGVRQLADVGIKALSPSLNDPSTAVNCVHRLTEILLVAGRRHEPPTAHRDDSGTIRFIAPQHDFDDLVGLAFDQLRAFGGERLYVTLAIIEGLGVLREALPQRRHGAIDGQLDRMTEAVATIELPADRAVARRALGELTMGGVGRGAGRRTRPSGG